MTRPRRVAVVGGGIIGLAVAERVLREDPSAQVTVLEKEHDWARHQTGRNSGVVHSGLYYPPGSLKARWCRAGADALLDLARAEGVPHRVTGKLVVATEESELGALGALHERGLANGLAVTRLTAAEAREHEPHVAALAALHVAETGVVDFRALCAVLVRRLRDGGARLLPGTEVIGGREGGGEVVLETTRGDVTGEAVVVCAGLHADRVARLLGHRPSVRIVPFRGEYRSLTPEAADLVRGLVYPVPDPRFPFLGVHLTRGVHDDVHAGPNAVLALAREGYGGHDDARRPRRHPVVRRVLATGRATTGAGPPRSPARCRPGASRAVCSGSCPRCARRTSSRPRPACEPRRSGATAASSTTSSSSGTAAWSTCSTRRHPRRRHRSRSPATSRPSPPLTGTPRADIPRSQERWGSGGEALPHDPGEAGRDGIRLLLVGASTITRTSGSVPDGRSSTRPEPPSAAPRARTADCRPSSVSTRPCRRPAR